MANKVTVVIPTYSRPDLVQRAIESVLNQTLTDYRCVVVDDNSPGTETERTVKSYESDKLAYVSHNENRGSGAARNTGIKHAESEYVAFLDDDDEWLPEKLEKQVALFDTLGEEYGLIYCWMDYIDGEGKVSRRYRPKHRGDVLPQVLDGQRIGACSTLLVRTHVTEEIDGFDESLARGVDGDFIRRVCRNYMVDYVPETLVRYHTGHGHQRITRYDQQGIRNAIVGKHNKLEKFSDELDAYPRRKANVYAGIAYHHGQLGEWDQCKEFYTKAIRTSIRSLPVYVKLLRSLYLLATKRVGLGRGSATERADIDG